MKRKATNKSIKDDAYSKRNSTTSREKTGTKVGMLKETKYREFEQNDKEEA